MVENFRPISLLSCLGKVVERVLQVRRSRVIEKEHKLSDQQMEFRPKKGCLEALWWVTEVVKKRTAEGKQTVAVFLDVKKAYDTMWHEGLWYRLDELGLGGKDVEMLRELHTGMTASIRVAPGVNTSPLPNLIGVRQGGISSATLYTVFIDSIVDDLKAAGIGVVERGVWAGNSLYADDMLALTNTVEEMKKAMEVVKAHAIRWRYRYNPTKCKVMLFNPKTAHPVCIKLAGVTLERVDSYKYLGVWLTPKLKWNLHIQKMKAKAERRVYALRPRVNREGGMNAEMAVNLWTAEIRPVFEYAIAVWGTALPARFMEEMEKFQRKTLKALMSVARTSNNEVTLLEAGVERTLDRRNCLAAGLWAKLALHRGGGGQIQALLRMRLTNPPPEWSWVADLATILHSRNVSAFTTVIPWTEETTGKWVEGVKEKIKDQWLATARRAVARCEKEQLYPRTEEDNAQSPWLRYSFSLGAKLLQRFRTGAHALEIELGRRHGVPRNERLCKACGGEVEDVPHFIARCPKLQHCRVRWWKVMKETLPREVAQQYHPNSEGWVNLILNCAPELEDEQARGIFIKATTHMIADMWVERDKMVQ